MDAINHNEPSPPSLAGDVGETVVRKRGRAFWLAYSATLIIDFLYALDLTAVSTPLPTIVHHLHGNEFIWAGSAYIIATTAVVPVVGGLASIFGRKPTMFAFLTFFFLGSGLCAGAQNMQMFIAGRMIEGFSGGGCIATSQIIYADLIPLPDRGKFLGIQSMVWALASSTGPLIGGALADAGAWRFLFWLNLPVSGIAAVLLMAFLHVHTPRDTFRSKMARMDWPGNVLITSSTTSFLIGLAWAGIQFSWTSAQVLVPVCLGAIGILSFLAVERWLIAEPTVPWYALSNRTSLSGYINTFLHGIASMAAIFYSPVYLQGAKGSSAVRSGVQFMAMGCAIPFSAIACGVSVQVLGRYRPQIYLGWMIMMVGFGLLSTLKADSPTSQYIGYQVVVGLGLGTIWASPTFPILTPLPNSNNAHALGFYVWTRSFAQSWAVVIGGTILQNRISTLLSSVHASIPHGTSVAYAVIPIIHTFPPQVQEAVRAAFAESTSLIWHVMIGVAGAGLLSCLLMREVKMRSNLDETWALQERKNE